MTSDNITRLLHTLASDTKRMAGKADYCASLPHDTSDEWHSAAKNLSKISAALTAILEDLGGNHDSRLSDFFNEFYNGLDDDEIPL